MRYVFNISSSRRRTALLFAIFVALSATAGAVSQDVGSGPRYQLTDLGALPHVADDVAMGVNASGQVSLWAAAGVDGVHAAWWSDGTMQDLGSPAGCPTSLARAINDKGKIAGWASTSGNPVDSLATVRAFVCEHGRFQMLGTLGGRESRAFGLNAAGQVVGVSNLADGRSHAFSSHGRAMTDLGTLPGGTFSQAYAINRAGHIAGVSDSQRPEKRGVLWRGGRIWDLGTLPGGRTSSARAINSHDAVAGYADCPDGYHAFLYTHGRMQDLGTLGDDPSAAYGLNDRGDVVGASNVKGSGRHAFLWQRGHLFDLNSRIPNDAGWTLTQADAINDRGQIVCAGHRNDGPPHALLLTPISDRH